MHLAEEGCLLWGDLVILVCVNRADPTAVQVRQTEVFQEANKCIAIAALRMRRLAATLRQGSRGATNGT